MTSTCFVVAFGHGTDSEHSESPRDMAEALRNLVETACKAKGRRFSTQSSVSVAPGGVMFALADDEPDRAVELCQAVMAQLEHQATTHQALPPVCAAITHGSLRQVDVLGFSSNFEGWPAIAAARVVAKLEPGELAIEQSVWEFASVLRDCGDPKPIPGKAHDTPFQVRIHRRIQFPTTVATAGAAAAAAASRQLAPYEAFAQTVRQQIHAILERSHMQEIREAITAQSHEVSPEDILVPAQPEALLEAMDSLHQATESCRPGWQAQPPATQKLLKQSLKDIVGRQALLIMNCEQLQALALDPQQDGLTRDIPLAMEAGLEVLVSSLGERAADFVLRIDNQQRARVIGRTSFLADELEHGLAHTDQLTGLLQRIWSEVMKPGAATTVIRPGGNRAAPGQAQNERKAREELLLYYCPAQRSACPAGRSGTARKPA